MPKESRELPQVCSEKLPNCIELDFMGSSSLELSGGINCSLGELQGKIDRGVGNEGLANCWLQTNAL